ncbi:MAG: RNA polymerase subunit sigma-70 [Comamonadaceae bacterium]|nr:MAG: RNA polymerase subunit sigma-70 [Comamonadaceae bacterium]
MSDYRLKVTIRNARLLRAIEAAGYRPGQSFANAVGISYGGQLLPYLNLTRSPLRPDGLLRDSAWALCDYLGASPNELWSDEQLTPLASNAFHKDLSYDQVRALSVTPDDSELDPRVLAGKSEAARLLLESLDTLTPKEARVIHERFGIGTCESTLEEVASRLDVSRERVREIESKALYKLRKSSRGLAAVAQAFDIAVPTVRSRAITTCQRPARSQP